PHNKPIESEQHGGRRIDGHRRRDFFERDAVEQTLHVGQRGDGHAGATHFARRQRMVRIHPHLGGKIEGHREAGSTLRKQVPVTLIAFFGAPEAGILAHGPEPLAVHVGIDAASVRKLAGLARFVVHELEILRAWLKQEMPYPAMMVTKTTVRTILATLPWPVSNSRSARIPDGIGQTASARKRKPMTSCQRVRAGRIKAGRRWRAN